jgi:retron-type reverse transcriptase
MELEPRDWLVCFIYNCNGNRMTNRDKTKSYEISKREVYSAWLRVRKNGGGSGVDGVSIADFEVNLSGNLYKLWNRMSSGSYFPQAVKRVEIPKPDGGKRPLGIPTIYDRVAQEVVRAKLETMVDPYFVADSYGFPTHIITVTNVTYLSPSLLYNISYFSKLSK